MQRADYLQRGCTCRGKSSGCKVSCRAVCILRVRSRCHFAEPWRGL